LKTRREKKSLLDDFALSDEEKRTIAGALTDLVSALSRRSPLLGATVAAGKAIWPVATALRNRQRESSTFTVKVLSTDLLWGEVHTWLLTLLPPEKYRSLIVLSEQVSSRMSHPFHDDGRPRVEKPPELRARYDGSREQVIIVGSHRVKVRVITYEGAGNSKAAQPSEVEFTASNLAARDALFTELRRLLEESVKRRIPSFRMLNKWDEWEKIDDLPARSPASVILPPGQLENLTADLSRFLAAEGEYQRRTIPWHRGYLFEGPPGTGKTSVAMALASYFGLDVWYMPLSDVKLDADLIRAVSLVGPRSLLLLEDVDVFHAARERNDTKEGVTLSGLLNALDGVGTPPGLVKVLTTNQPGVLDQALIRPGRVDVTEVFGLSGCDEVARFIARWYDVPVGVFLGGAEESLFNGAKSVALAEVAEACKRHDDATAAVAAVIELMIPWKDQ
jgi:hypothetical protein